jgi:hypothetical protein
MAAFGLYLVACGLLVLAGLAKAVRPGDTARAVVAVVQRGQGLRRWERAVRLLAGVETALGALGLAFPQRAVASAVAVSYLAFTCFVLVALATCGCFGSPDTPPTLTHALVTLALAAASFAVALAAPAGTVVSVLGSQSANGFPLVVTSAVAGLLVWAVLSPLARLSALRAVTPR